MISEYIKIFAPVVFFAMFFVFALKVRFKRVAGVALFFTGFVACSSNFMFFYRETYQAIQILLVLFFVFMLAKGRTLYRFNYILIGFLLFIFISLVFSGIDEYAKTQLLNFFVVAGVVNYIYMVWRSSEDFDACLRYFSLLAFVASLFGIIEYAASSGGRVEASFANSNYFGYFLGLGFCFAFAKIQTREKWLFMLVIVLGIFASGSRAALVFPVIQTVWWLHRSGNLTKKMVLGGTFMAALLVVFNSGVLRVSDVEASSASDAERIIFLHVGLRMVSDHPLTGVGWGRFPAEFSNYSSLVENIVLDAGVIDVSGQEGRVSHNDFLRVLSELGWVAFVLFVAITIKGGLVFVRSIDHRVIAFFPAWFGTLIFSLTHNNMNSALFWFVYLLPFFIVYLRRERIVEYG